MSDKCETGRGYRMMCRVCQKEVCNNPIWEHGPDCVVCTHEEKYDYAKKDRFVFESNYGAYQMRDNETQKTNCWDGSGRQEWSLLHILNQLAFELEVLKKQHVKDTE